MSAVGTPFISVVVPVFNGEVTIEACLESLLTQTYLRDRYEIIVVDNDSTDGTVDVIKRYPVRYVLEREVQSSYAARNRGIREATGDIIAFTDADCVASRDWLRQAVDAFAHERIGGVAGAIRSCEPQTLAQRYAVEKGALSQETALRANSFLPAVYTANAFYRKTVLEQAGLFDPLVKSGGDADLAWRVQERLGQSIAFCPEAIVYHRHRERIWDLLRQRKNYGYGSVVNYVKHRDQMGSRTLKHAYWEVCALSRTMGTLLGTVLRRVVGRRPKGRDDDLAVNSLDLLVFFAKKIGQLQAAVKYRIWYF